jgi:hypothetical protein
MSSPETKIIKYLGKHGPTSSRDMLSALGIEMRVGRDALNAMAKKGSINPPGARGKTLYALPDQKIVNGNGTAVNGHAATAKPSAVATGKPGLKKAAAPPPPAAVDPTPWAGAVGSDPLAILKAEYAEYEDLVRRVTAAAARAEKVKAAIAALEGAQDDDSN